MSTRYETAKRVTESGNAGKLEGALLDIFTAGAIVAVYEGLSERNQERFDSIPLDRFLEFIWKVAA